MMSTSLSTDTDGRQAMFLPNDRRKNGEDKAIPLGEATHRNNRLFFSISKVKHRGVHKTYTTAFLSNCVS
jgi:hypothetical protein